MHIKIKIVRNVSSDEIKGHVPQKFTDIIQMDRTLCLTQNRVNAIVFIGDDVVTSAKANKGIEKLGEEDGLQAIAVGTRFTIEAIDLLKKHAIDTITLHDFPYTDRSQSDRN